MKSALKLLTGLAALARRRKPPHAATPPGATARAIQDIGNMEDRLEAESARANRLEDEVRHLRAARMEPEQDEPTLWGATIGLVILVSVLWLAFANTP